MVQLMLEAGPLAGPCTDGAVTAYIKMRTNNRPTVNGVRPKAFLNPKTYREVVPAVTASLSTAKTTRGVCWRVCALLTVAPGRSEC